MTQLLRDEAHAVPSPRVCDDAVERKGNAERGAILPRGTIANFARVCVSPIRVQDQITESGCRKQPPGVLLR